MCSVIFFLGNDAARKPIVATRDPVIPPEAVRILYKSKNELGMPTGQALQILRDNLVPEGQYPYSFRTNIKETSLDMLRTIYATFYFRHQIKKIQATGRDFSLYMYIPVLDPLTGEYVHHREDHAHLLKLLWLCTIKGNFVDLNSKGFEAASDAKECILTKSALTGERPQSVKDAEIFFSFNHANWLLQNMWHEEGRYILTVAQWHEASDGRGLSQLTRCRYNWAFLNFIISRWQPGLSDSSFSQIDINIPTTVTGLTRECFIGVTCNIYSQEWRRFESDEPEHPRASTTDDVENFFSLVRRDLGNSFTAKEFVQQWPSAVREFMKRMDSNLPFYYWTLNERFSDYDARRPNFDQPNDNPLRLHNLRHTLREDPAQFQAGRSWLPVRGHVSKRSKFFRAEAPLPMCPRKLALPAPSLPPILED